ncbi:MAG: translocation/assembly module TamB domain-containing protein [Dinoroseobacter sp.]|nr:translocation/assembly module TamB domain-containing protein [Dinoroseobacter sp.]
MRVALVLFTAAFVSVANAQEETQEEGSRGLAGLLERSLSSENMQVRVEGLQGALSAAAQIERLSFSDAEGVWLVIEGAVLDWNRTALLRGRVDVNRLEAQRISLERTPIAQEDTSLPEPAARTEPFSLPELPVSVDVDVIAAPEIILGEALLGEEIEAALEGSIQLANGNAQIALDLRRTDVEGTSVVLGAGFSNETSVLDLALEVVARPDGLIVRKLGLPESPGIDLTVDGSGPLSDFVADIALRTDNALRLGGTVELQDPEGSPPRIIADISGDVRPLVPPDLDPFFGPETALRFSAVSNEDGSRELEQFHITTEALDLAGEARLGTNGWPEQIALTGLMGRADGQDVQLPVAGPALTVNRAKLALNYDADQDSVWSALLSATGVAREDVGIDTADLRGAGKIDLPTEASEGAVEGQLLFGVDGLDLGTPELNTATGDEVRISTLFDWQAGGDLVVEELQLEAGGARLDFDGTLGQAAENLPATGSLTADVPDLGRYASLIGQALSGSLTLDAEGSATLLTGAFDLVATGNGTELSTGITPVDQLLLGRADFALSAVRDVNGFTLREVSAETPAITFAAEGARDGATTTLDANVTLDDLGRLVPSFPGPVTVDLDVAQADRDLGVEFRAEGPVGTTARGSGTVAQDFSTFDLGFNASARLALLNPIIQPLTTAGQLDADLTISGPPELSSVSGTISLAEARLAEPTIGLTLQNGQGQVALGGENAQISLSAQGNKGGTLSVDGGVGLTTPISTDLSVGLERFGLEIPGFLTTSVSADIGLNGALPDNALLAGTIDLGETEIRIPDGGTPDAITEGIVHVGDTAEARLTRDRAGIGAEQAAPPEARGSSGGLGLDLRILANNRVFIRGFGLDAELTGDIEVAGTTNDPRPVGEIELVRGRLAILGQRLDLDEGRITLLASLIPDLYFAASSTSDEATVTVAISGPANEPEFEVTSSPPLPEDEALAQLLFGRSLDELSGFQALQLANSIIALRSGTGLGFVNSLRESTGLDDIDLDNDGEGNTNLRVGKYLTEDIYTNVDVNSSGETGISLNIDLTNALTARGTVANDGDSSLGFFFERDY